MKPTTLLQIALCFASFIGTSAWALSLADITVKGEIRNRGFYLSNYKGNSNNDQFVLTRSLIELNLKPVQNIESVIMIGGTRLWGSSSSFFQVTEPGAAQPLPADLYNAYIKVTPWQDFSLTIGRQFAGEKDDAFFFYGPQKGRLLEVTSLDALRFDTAVGPVNIFGLFGKKVEDDTAVLQAGTGKDQDQDILALNLRSTQLVEKQDFSLGLYQRRIGQQDLALQPDNLYMFTARALGQLPVPGLEYDVMGSVNGGSNSIGDPYKGWLGRAIGHYTLSELPYTSVKATLGYVYVSGDTDATDGKDGNFRRLSRDCFYNMALIVYELLNDTAPEAVANVAIPFAGLELMPHGLDQKLKIKTMYSYLTAPAAIRVAGVDNYVKGSEIYVKADYAVMDNLAFELTASRFWPGDIFQALFPNNDPYNQLTLDVTVSF